MILGSAMNSGGKTSGYTVPNPTAQAELISTALDAAGVEASTISYVEAHGTGTALGDPIEILGLKRAFGAQPPARCAVGSVKANIGHLESAAGVSALIKVLLQLRHRRIVASIHSGRLNPKLELAGSPFYVPQTAGDWEPLMRRDEAGRLQPLPRRAGISSFGAGGSNVHVILAEHNIPAMADEPPDAPHDGPFLIVLSARDEERLRESARRLARHITAENSHADERFREDDRTIGFAAGGACCTCERGRSQ